MEWIDGNIGCLAEGSTVTTPGGVKPIEQVTPGDEVLSFDHDAGKLCWRRVTAKRNSGRQAVREVRVGERRLRVTDNHPFLSYTYDPHRPKKLGRYALAYVRADHLSHAIVPTTSLDYGDPHKLERPDSVSDFVGANQHRATLRRIPRACTPPAPTRDHRRRSDVAVRPVRRRRLDRNGSGGQRLAPLGAGDVLRAADGPRSGPSRGHVRLAGPRVGSPVAQRGPRPRGLQRRARRADRAQRLRRQRPHQAGSRVGAPAPRGPAGGVRRRLPRRRRLRRPWPTWFLAEVGKPGAVGGRRRHPHDARHHVRDCTPSTTTTVPSRSSGTSPRATARTGSSSPPIRASSPTSALRSAAQPRRQQAARLTYFRTIGRYLASRCRPAVEVRPVVGQRAARRRADMGHRG